MCVCVYITCTFCLHMPLDVTYETVCVHFTVIRQGVLTMKVGEHCLSQFYQFYILAQMSVCVFFFPLPSKPHI